MHAVLLKGPSLGHLPQNSYHGSHGLPKRPSRSTGSSSQPFQGSIGQPEKIQVRHNEQRSAFLSFSSGKQQINTFKCVFIMQEQRSPIESQANTQNRSVPCCPESRNGHDDRQVKEHFTKDSCLLNNCPQEGIRKGLLSNMQQLFNPAEWLASNSPSGMTSVPPLL